MSLLTMTLAPGAQAAEPVEPRIGQLRWLAGCWGRSDADAGSGEQWTTPAGGTMLGLSRTVRGQSTVEHEFVVIRAAPDGVLVYQAHPSGQVGAEFRLARLDDAQVVFENPGHDFPQRIGYRLEDDGRLTAWIEGTRAGVVERRLFPMQRTPCPQPGTLSPAAQPEAGRP